MTMHVSLYSFNNATFASSLRQYSLKASVMVSGNTASFKASAIDTAWKQPDSFFRLSLCLCPVQERCCCSLLRGVVSCFNTEEGGTYWANCCCYTHRATECMRIQTDCAGKGSGVIKNSALLKIPKKGIEKTYVKNP